MWGIACYPPERSRQRADRCIYLLKAPALFSQQIMDEKTRSVLAQAIRDAFASSGIDQNEEYIDSLVSRVDSDGTLINLDLVKIASLTMISVLEAHLSVQDGRSEDTVLKALGGPLPTPPTTPSQGRGSYRIS